jgi:putative colanic acid biosynthesis acetyltransferase WcaF
MAREIGYDSSSMGEQQKDIHPSQRASFPLRDRLRRLVWNICHALLYRTSPRPAHAWRSMLLRAFGAEIGRGCHFYPKSMVWAPWNLTCEANVTAADGAELYNPAPMFLGENVIVSQNAYVCGATHDYNDATFPLIAYRMRLGRFAWVCARASVGPGVSLGDGAVLGLGGVATRDLEPWSVYAGNPAVRLRDRLHEDRPLVPQSDEPQS